VLAASTLVGAAGCARLDPASGALGVVATGCPPGTSNGSGVAIAPRLVLTAAHVVKGGGHITVTNGFVSLTGTIAAFDPEADLALIALDRPFGRTFDLYDGDAAAIADGTEAVAHVMREGEIVTVPVTVRRSITLRSEDIYVQGMYEHPAWELDAEIQSGDSGGAVLVDGEVIGVLRFRSNARGARAYAVDPVRAGAVIETQRASGELGDVDLERCYTE
jgi:S1-C subfamily serine protease